MQTADKTIRNEVFPENHCITFNKHSLILCVLPNAGGLPSIRRLLRRFPRVLFVYLLPISQSHNISLSFQSPIDRDTSHATNISIEEHSV